MPPVLSLLLVCLLVSVATAVPAGAAGGGVDPEYEDCMVVATQLNKQYYATIDSPMCAEAKKNGQPSWNCAGVFLTTKDPFRKIGLSKAAPGRCATLKELGVDGFATTADDGYKNGVLMGSANSSRIASWCPSGSWSKSGTDITHGDIRDGHLSFSILRSDITFQGPAAIYTDGKNPRGGFILDGSRIQNRFLAFWPTDAATTGFPGCGVWTQYLWDGPNKPPWAANVTGGLWSMSSRSCFPVGDQGNRGENPKDGVGSTVLPYVAPVSKLQDPDFTAKFNAAKCDAGDLDKKCSNSECNSCPVAKEDFDSIFVKAFKTMKAAGPIYMHNEIALQEHSGTNHADIPVSAFFYHSNIEPVHGKAVLEQMRADLYQQKFCYQKFSGGRKVPVVYVDLSLIGQPQPQQGGPFSCSKDPVQSQTFSGWPLSTLDPQCNGHGSSTIDMVEK